MQDRFKFRVWLKDTNKMYNVHSLHIGTNKAIISSRYGNVSIYINKNSILMQCTGLKDKNDKFIYEGDIVQTTFGDNSKIIFYVIWSNENALFNGKIIKKIKTNAFCINEDYLYYLLANNIDEKTEVIGNIYENPELLKE